MGRDREVGLKHELSIDLHCNSGVAPFWAVATDGVHVHACYTHSHLPILCFTAWNV